MIKPTIEQATCLKLAATGGSLAISALAGSGKTSTLRLIAGDMPNKRIAYLAFNRAIANEAATRFPANTDCVTVHSLAYRAIGWQYKTKLDGKLTPAMVRKAINLSDKTDQRTAMLIIRTVHKFVKSSALEFSDSHVDNNLLSVILKHTDDQDLIARSKRFVIYNAVMLFNLMADSKSDVPIDHDFYLKLWQMSSPVLNYDVVFLDECQDADAVMLDIIGRQSAQVIIVGDQWQNLYAWRSTVDAFKVFPVDNKAELTQSFRFGNAIAAIANVVLHGSAVIQGSEITSKVYRTGDDSITAPNCIIARTNYGVIGAVLEQLDNDLKVYVEGGTKAITYLLSGILDLMGKGKSYHPELSMFNSWQELCNHADTDEGQEYKQMVLLVRKYAGRLPYLIVRLKSCVDDPTLAHVTVSTCHKAKGKEWQSVRLCDDFKLLELNADGDVINVAEQCVLYVAVTRAISVLDVTNVKAIDDLMK